MFKTDRLTLLLIIIFALLIIVQPAFAAENQTDLEADSQDSVAVSNSDESVLMGDNDYYFDASLENDTGDGSQANPYKYLKADRIRANSNIHLANGEYNLDKSVNIEKVNIYGSNPSSTILRYDGNYALKVLNSLTLNNLTLYCNIINTGMLDATNCIFMYGEGYNPSPSNGYGNVFGGAIYSTGTSLCLNNCSFIDNWARYGGAVYVSGGNLNISNSRFSDNQASDYGGSIACENHVNAFITNVTFINSKTVLDVGGAIYLRESTLNAEYLNVINSSATVGGAVFCLDSNLAVTHSNFENNSALFDGGAIYHMYNELLSTYNTFNNNSARNGGAVFVDKAKVFVRSNVFSKNNASAYGGAFYSVLANLTSGSIRYMNTFTDNHAYINDDEYMTDSYSLVIGDGNYTLYRLNATEIAVIPSRYSLLEDIGDTPVKNQQGSGSCWAFATLAALESAILKSSGQYVDLSAENMKNVMANYGDYGWKIAVNSGGKLYMMWGYLTGLLGPVFSFEEPYSDHSAFSPVMDSYMHVQNIIFLGRDNYTDNDAIKMALLKYGAVATTMAYSGNYYNSAKHSYYCNSNIDLDHAVTIVGWDDTYSASNFRHTPSGDGAWIVKNSWGPGWGDNGYFYVSYYDTRFALPGAGTTSFAFILNDTIGYDKSYQYDIPGMTDYMISYNSTLYYKNVFNATDDEYLAAVSTYFEKLANWTLSVYVNGNLNVVQSGMSPAGYYTIELSDIVTLNKGDTFEVMFSVSCADASFPISEIYSLNNQLYDFGYSYISYDGINWFDLCNYTLQIGSHSYDSAVACIKAFTFLDEIDTSTKLDIECDGVDSVNITAYVLDKYGNIVRRGNVTFNVEGVDYLLGLSDGYARLTHDFKTLSSIVSAAFVSNGYVGSFNETILEIPTKTVSLDLALSQFRDTVNITVIANRSISQNVIIMVNDIMFNETLINGMFNLMLADLENGHYDVEVSLDENPYYESDSKFASFDVDVKNTQILVKDVITYFNLEDFYNITLIDEDGIALADKNVTIEFNGETYYLKTNASGIVSIPFRPDYVTCNAVIRFDGDDGYRPSVNESLFDFSKRMVSFDVDISQYQQNANVTVMCNASINQSVAIVINNDKRYNETLINGMVTLKLTDLINGHYDVEIILLDNDFYDADEKHASFDINVKDTQILVRDVITYYNLDDLYRIALVDEEGTPLAGKNVTFEFDADSFQSVTDENGIVIIPFAPGFETRHVTISFAGENNYFSSRNESLFDFSKRMVSFDLDITQYQHNVKLTVICNESINQTVSILINDNEMYNRTLLNGRATLSLAGLANGHYDIEVSICDNVFYDADKKYGSFDVNVKDTQISAGNITAYYRFSDSYTVYLVDEDGHALSGKSVTVTLNGKTYSSLTNASGIASFPLSLGTGTYPVSVEFSGDESYMQSSASGSITVKKSIELSANAKYTYGSKFSATVWGRDGKLSGNKATIEVAGAKYTVTSNSEGKIRLNIGLKPGSYKVTVTNLETGEVASQTITVAKRLSENSDVNMYYGAGKSYKVRAFTDNGSPVSSGEIVKITICGKTYDVKTDKNGYASLKINLKPGTYSITAEYKGYKVSNKITVKTTLIAPNLSVKKGTTIKYYAKLLDTNGKIMVNKLVTFKFNGKTYSAKTSQYGYAIIYIKNSLNVGKYTVTSTYGALTVKNTITIVK